MRDDQRPFHTQVPENYGVIYAGACYGPAVFHFGSDWKTAEQASTSQLRAKCKGFVRAMRGRSARALLGVGVVTVELMLCSMVGDWLLSEYGVATLREDLRWERLKLTLMLSTPVLTMTWVLLYDWWCDQREILKALRRGHAELRAALDVRERQGSRGVAVRGERRRIRLVWRRAFRPLRRG